MISAGKLPKNARFSTNREEMEHLVELTRDGHYSRGSDFYGYLFGKDGNYIRQYMLDGLRVPPEIRRPLEPDFEDEYGPKFVRIWLLGDEEIGHVPVPPPGVVPYTTDVWDVLDPVTGFARITENYTGQKHIMHRAFNRNPRPDESGNRDVAVARWCGWPLDVREGCLYVIANYGRWDAYSNGGSRPVQGQFKIRTEQTFG